MLKKLLAAALTLFAAMAFAAVDVNKASQADLETVKGIGPGIAGKIIDERKKGAFKNWQDLVDRVKGVGEGNVARMSSEGLTVNGATFTGAPGKADDKPPVRASMKMPPDNAAAKPETKGAGAKADAKAAGTPDAKPAVLTAEDKKAAVKKEKEEKKATKAAATEEAKKAKTEKADTAKAAKADAKSDKAGPKDAKPGAAAAASAPAKK